MIIGILLEQSGDKVGRGYHLQFPFACLLLYFSHIQPTDFSHHPTEYMPTPSPPPNPWERLAV